MDSKITNINSRSDDFVRIMFDDNLLIHLSKSSMILTMYISTRLSDNPKSNEAYRISDLRKNLTYGGKVLSVNTIMDAIGKIKEHNIFLVNEYKINNTTHYCFYVNNLENQEMFKKIKEGKGKFITETITKFVVN